MNEIIIRRYREQDIPQILSYVQECLIEDRGDKEYTNHYKDVDFDRQKVHNTFIHRINDPDFFCNLIFADEDIVGGLCAYVAEPFFSSDRIAYDQLLYITPTFHNVKAVIRLFKSYIEWAERRNTIECRMCSSTGYNQEGFTKLCQRMGFTQFEVGFARRFI
jgi:hypothetical protein